MSKVRVHELAKEFELENKEVIQRLNAAEITAKTHSSSVDRTSWRAQFLRVLVKRKQDSSRASEGKKHEDPSNNSSGNGR